MNMGEKNNYERNELTPSISLESLFYLADWHVCYYDAKGRYIDCNKETYQFLNMSKEELLNKTDFDLPWKASADEWMENNLKVMLSNRPMEFSENLIHYKNKFKCSSIKFPIYSGNKVKGLLTLVKIARETPLVPISRGQTISKKELECLYYLIKGLALKQIAHMMQISPRTVQHHINHAKTKLNCYHRSDLIEKASQLPEMKNKLFLNSVSQLPEVQSP